MSRAVISSNVQIDDISDTITIYGIRYSGELFRELGFAAAEGTRFEIGKRHDGTLILHRIDER